MIAWGWPLGARPILAGAAAAMRALDHHRQPGYLQAMKQIATNAKKERDEATKKSMRAEKTEHRLLAVFLTASKLWR